MRCQSKTAFSAKFQAIFLFIIYTGIYTGARRHYILYAATPHTTSAKTPPSRWRGGGRYGTGPVYFSSMKRSTSSNSLSRFAVPVKRTGLSRRPERLLGTAMAVAACRRLMPLKLSFTSLPVTA